MSESKYAVIKKQLRELDEVYQESLDRILKGAFKPQESSSDITKSCVVRPNADGFSGVIDIHDEKGKYIASFDICSEEPLGFDFSDGFIRKDK